MFKSNFQLSSMTEKQYAALQILENLTSHLTRTITKGSLKETTVFSASMTLLSALGSLTHSMASYLETGVSSNLYDAANALAILGAIGEAFVLDAETSDLILELKSQLVEVFSTIDEAS